MTKFKTKPRYDRSISEAGVWFTVEDDEGNYYHSFKVSHWDITSNRAEKQLNDLRKQYAERFKDETFKDSWEWFAVSFAKTQVHDWKDVEAEDGTPLPFSADDAAEFFLHEDNRWMIGGLATKAANLENYKKKAEEKIEGNSEKSSTGDTASQTVKSPNTSKTSAAA